MAEVLYTHSTMGLDMGRNRDTLAPAALPAFQFPVQPEKSNEASSHGRSTSGLDATTPRHARNRSRPQRLSINALPAFDFSPASSVPISNPSSPPRSPSRRTPPHHHSGGHRRNGSEFVGGDITNGGPVLVSSSPTKTEYSMGHKRGGSGLPGETTPAGGRTGTMPLPHEGASHSQPDLRLGPPTTRRGHAHRRSGAISSHDVSLILKPFSDAKGGSAPTTPSDAMFQPTMLPALDRSTSQPVFSASQSESSKPPTEEESSTDGESCNEGGQLRSRVRISDVLEFIPRPLSTISSETSSSISTIRANHSLTSSITSFFSVGTSSPPPTIMAASRRSQSSLQDQTRQRPSTAVESPRSSSVDSEPEISGSKAPPKRSSSAPPRDSPPKATDDSLDTFVHVSYSAGDGAPDHVLSSADSRLTKSDTDTDAMFTEPANLHSRRRMISSNSSPCIRPRTSPEPKVTKRQQKGRSWHGILSRKAKPEVRSQALARRSPTPPLQKPSPEPEISFDNISFGDDTDCIIETASPYRSSAISTDHFAPNPRESSPHSDTEGSATMFDIDAALGSLDAPSYGPAFEDAFASNTPSAKRPMHSSGCTGGFAGPGMHYHRRAESAPELEPVDRSRFGFPRLGSNPAMAIEEEEEESDEENSHVSSQRAEKPSSSQGEYQDGQASGLSVNIVETASTNENPMRRRRRRTNDDGIRTPEDLTPAMPLDINPVEIVGAEEEPRFSVVTKSSDESTITPTLSHDPREFHSDSAPLDFAMPTPALTYGTPETPSAVSSPDFTRTSFDVPRLHTASSSITDRATLSSSRAGYQGLGLQASVDDVPSLTSSASTMSARPPRISSSANSGFSADRSSSLSAAVPTQTRPVSSHKRLSLASLSRLAGSSYNRSKLNITESIPSESVDQTEKKKKGHRISRLMKFWKSKEKLSS